MFSQLFGARSFAVSLRASALSIFAVSLLPTASFALDSAAQPLVSDEEEALEAETATEVEATPADVAPASFAPSEWQVARQTPSQVPSQITHQRPQSSASQYRVRSNAGIKATVPTGKTTMVSAVGERLVSAIFDNREVEVQAQSNSGRLFVLPLIEGSVNVFVTTESGETVSLELLSEENAPLKNIVLERKGTVDERFTPEAPMRRLPARVLSSGDYVGSLKAELLALVTRDPNVVEVLEEAPSPEVKSLLEKLRTSSPLKPQHVTLLGNEAFTGTVVTCRHGGLKPIVIDPQTWTRGMIEASAVSAQYIKPGEVVELYFLERH